MLQTRISKRMEWANKIDLWRQSGKNARVWCNENQVAYQSFLGWCKRLESEKNVESLSNPLKSEFVELKSNSKTSQGISLEYDGILIHLKVEFDSLLLKRCLAVLRGASC